MLVVRPTSASLFAPTSACDGFPAFDCPSDSSTTVMHPQFAPVASIAAFSLFLALPLQWRTGSIATPSIITFATNIVFAVDVLIWFAAMWCEITTYIILGASFALPAASLCTRVRGADVFGLPMLFMLLRASHLIDFFLLFLTPPSLLRRPPLRLPLWPHPSRYLHPILISVLQMVWALAFTAHNPWFTLAISILRPYVSWARSRRYTNAAWWVTPATTVIFVAFYAFLRESVQDYKREFACPTSNATYHLPTFIGRTVAGDAKPLMGSMLAFAPPTQLSLPLSARYRGAASAVSVV
ncbi:hypothetical protein K438DRAFT_1995770 [Mycena galopus ATCC 62051]|nr:hypothetical protein K438DRAFT_1995770 [Mycena galopus ATCC 62051]